MPYTTTLRAIVIAPNDITGGQVRLTLSQEGHQAQIELVQTDEIVYEAKIKPGAYILSPRAETGLVANKQSLTIPPLGLTTYVHFGDPS